MILHFFQGVEVWVPDEWRNYRKEERARKKITKDHLGVL